MKDLKYYKIVFLVSLFLAAGTFAVSSQSLSKQNLRSASAFVSQVQSNALNSSNAFSRATNNLTVIQQIGNSNSIFSSVTSGSSSLQYAQIGNENAIKSVNTIERVEESIVQYGNNNSVLNYGFGNVTTSSLDLIQNGNNLSFQKIGTNSQTNNLSFMLTGANRSIIVRSY